MSYDCVCIHSIQYIYIYVYTYLYHNIVYMIYIYILYIHRARPLEGIADHHSASVNHLIKKGLSNHSFGGLAFEASRAKVLSLKEQANTRPGTIYHCLFVCVEHFTTLSLLSYDMLIVLLYNPYFRKKNKTYSTVLLESFGYLPIPAHPHPQPSCA